MENHVTSLELSKKLKELGVPQESGFYWRFLGEKFVLIANPEIEEELGYDILVTVEDDDYSAFLASELGEMLPTHVIKEKKYYELVICRLGLHWVVSYGNGKECLHSEEDEKMADCLAKMLIYLLEKSIITIEDLV